ncbi:hypothetical protein KLA_00500 [Cellulophaga geojensis KL-A]|uniref:Late embryogenesis abundant protein LEA-2 subgroup domain-containing protein n=2 Tax=Cellulophaga TaxID=104264 RepID=A0ABP3BB26_9FLAO|nr:hypothetical protein KLA_00500 [Cellulophaga geojensis KL-A]
MITELIKTQKLRNFQLLAMLKKQLKTIITLVTLSLVFSCINNTIKKSNNIISINYPESNLFKIKDDNWIIIDDIKVTHKNNIEKVNNFSIPSYSFTSLKVEGKTLTEKANTIDMGMHLYNVLKHSNKYIFHNKAEILINGKITFSRKDKKKILIEYKKNYPVNISF